MHWQVAVFISADLFIMSPSNINVFTPSCIYSNAMCHGAINSLMKEARTPLSWKINCGGGGGFTKGAGCDEARAVPGVDQLLGSAGGLTVWCGGGLGARVLLGPHV